MSGFAMRREKKSASTAVRSADHSVRRNDRTGISAQSKARLDALAYTQEPLNRQESQMYLTMKDDKKAKAAKMTTQKSNMPASKPDWHRDMHMWNKANHYINMAIQTKRENFLGTGVIQRETGLKVGSYVRISSEQNNEGNTDKVGQIVLVTDGGYYIDSENEKKEYDESHVQHLPLNIEHIYSVLHKGILSQKAMGDNGVSPGSTTDNTADDNIHVVRFIKKADSPIPDPALTNPAYGAFIIALESGKINKIKLPTQEECIKEEGLENISTLQRYAVDIYVKNHYTEHIEQLKPQIEEQIRNSMLVICKQITDKDDVLNKADNAPNDMETIAKELMSVKSQIKPERFFKVFLPQEVELQKGIGLMNTSPLTVEKVANTKMTFDIPAHLLFYSNAKISTSVSFDLEVPDYANALKTESGVFYSHLVRL